MRRDVAIEIIAPDQGLDSSMSASMIGERYSPSMTGANAFFGVLQKEYGTSLFCTGTGAGVLVNHMYEANFGANAVLGVYTNTALLKYSSALNTVVLDSPGTYGGTFGDQWSACLHNDALIYSNGVDLVQYKASYSATGTVMGGVATSSYKAVAVVSVAEHLCMYRTTETGSENRKRVRWTKAGLLGYTGTDWTAGTAGFLDLADMEGSIMCAERMGNAAAVVYGERSIHLQEWVGGTDVYRFTKMVVNNGVASRRAVVANGMVHYILARDKNVYEYSGGRDLKSIGDKIKPLLTALINDSAIATAFLEFLPNDNELRVHIPTGTSSYPDTCFICKVNDNYRWFKAPSYYTAKGDSSRVSALTIGELVGNIGAQNWKFGDKSVDAGATVYLLVDQGGHLVKRDKAVYSYINSGTSILQTFTFDTKELTSVNDIDPLTKNKYELTDYMDNMTRWEKLKVEAKGNGSLICQFSTDGGSNYTDFDESPITLTTDWKMHQLDVDRCAERFSVRFSNTGTNEIPMLRYLKMEIVPGGEL